MASRSGTYHALSDDNSDDITLASVSLDGKTPVPSIYSADNVLYPTKEDLSSEYEPGLQPKVTFHEIDKVPGWPTEPKKPKSTSKRLIAVLADVACIISSLPFLALALTAVHYTGLEVENGLWRRYQNVSRIVSVIAGAQFSAMTIF
jgi:hypothetical protein